MLSHYALFIAGFALGYALFRFGRRLWLVGVFFAVLWHTPQAFALSAAMAAYRLLEESTLLAGGVLTGSSAHSMGEKTKLALLALWVVGDTLLSVVFIGRPELYSRAPHSPYGSSGFPPTGVAMIVFMNVVLAYTLYEYAKKVGVELAGGRREGSNTHERLKEKHRGQNAAHAWRGLGPPAGLVDAHSEYSGRRRHPQATCCGRQPCWWGRPKVRAPRRLAHGAANRW